VGNSILDMVERILDLPICLDNGRVIVLFMQCAANEITALRIFIRYVHCIICSK
jgi:hypothetical protein